ncbi:hypothetical protein EMIT0P228_10103 [Pseudomonas brassicacearum]
MFLFVGFMDRELGLVELLHRWVGGLYEARLLPFAIILNLYRFIISMAGCRTRVSDFFGVDMTDYQQEYSRAACHEDSHWPASIFCVGDMFAAVPGQGYCQG